MRPLSYTQISLYRTCPLSYKLQYIDGLKPKDKWYFSFGTTMHSCAERFFKVNTPPPPSLPEMLEFYEQNWISEAYESPEEEAQYKEYGREILTRFWEIHSAGFRMPIAIERMFYIDVGGVKLRGFMDRVDKLDSGGLSIIDYKTNKDLFTTDYLDADLQLTIYQMAASQLWRLPVEKLTLYHLRSNTACSCPPRSEERLEEARKLVNNVAGNIQQGIFPATENEYCPCDFPEYCPYYRHQYMIEAPEPPRQGLLPGIAAIDAVEEYASLQAQIKELETRLEEAKQKIIDYCRDEDLNRIFGNEHEVTYKVIERTGFDIDEVKGILEPEGLWEKVLGFDQSLLNNLLTDKGLPESVRDSLESVRRITSTYPQLRVKKRTGEEK